MEKEEGEMSDDNSMVIEENMETPMDTSSVLVYEPKQDGIIIKELGKTDAVKLEERAKRFGLVLTGRKAISQKQIDELYENFGIKNGEERHFRFDTLHLYGINGLTTKDIFEYLEDYRPVSLERINNKSCNVVCHDHISAALALLLHSREIADEDVKKMILSTSAHHWREGFPHPKKDLILFRFATKSDKKDSASDFEKSMDKNDEEIHSKLSKNPWGDLCKSWGIYDHQEIFNRQTRETNYYSDDDIYEIIVPKNKKLAKRLGKRGQTNVQLEESDSDREWQSKSKIPRMRMHADDEESKKHKNLKVLTKIIQDPNDYASLSIEVVNSDSPPHHRSRSAPKLSDKFKKQPPPKVDLNVRSRLGPRIQRCSESSSDGDSEHNVMSRVHKIPSECNDNIRSSSVWSRLNSDKGENANKTDLRQTLRSKKGTEDLRKKIDNKSRSGRSPLRIEIDNEYYDSE